MLRIYWKPMRRTKLRNVYGLTNRKYIRAIRVTPSSLNVGEPSFDHFTKYSSLANKISTPARDCSVDDEVAQSNWLITKLSREGRIQEARRMFDEMLDKDVVTWTTVISGYIKCRKIEEARKLFNRADAVKNVVTWTALLGGYVKLNKIHEAERLFKEMPERNVISWNTMIDGYVRCGKVDSALHLFNTMPERNVVSWNTIVTALAQCGRIEEARRLFDQMPVRDVISWTAMVTGLSKNGRIDEARAIFDRMPDRNVVSWNAMVTSYAQNLRLDEAFDLFVRMPEKDLASWNTMITGFIQNGELGRASELFNEMSRRNVISWTTMITGYVQNGQNEEALHTFSRMLAEDRVRPNVGTFVSVLGACSNLAGLCEGQQVHQIISKTMHQEEECVVSALINMYSKCGELSIGRKMFDDSPINQRDLVSWNGIIAAYAHHGFGREAIRIFEDMQKSGLKPNDVSYVSLLSACSHSGLVEEGLRYFEELVKDESIQLREDHYACLVDLCGRAGRLSEALQLIEKLRTRPSASLWGALLAGCNVHGHTEIGKVAAKKMLKLEPDNAGTYTLLYNIYKSTGKSKQAAEVRLKMKVKGLKKQPGCSWIEIGNRVNVFVVGDKSHDEYNLMSSALHDLHHKMKKSGPVSSDTDDVLLMDDDLITS